MAEEGAFDEGSDGLLLVGVELADGLEVVGDLVGHGALAVLKDEHICAGVQGEGRLADDIEGGGWLVPAS